MKKFFLFIALVHFIICARGQIVFEHTYDSTATFAACGAVGQLMIVDFELSGQHYVAINRCGAEIKIYNLAHQLQKTISLANVPKGSSGYYQSFMYFSETLFDIDSGIEFMHVVMDTSLRTYIFNEDGSQLFFAYGAPLVFQNIHVQQYPVYNTAAGTKLILSNQNGDAKVYNLRDSSGITTQIDKKPVQHSAVLSAPRPNPSNTGCMVEYVLPEGISEGEIVFYDLAGRQAKSFKVGAAFTTLYVSTADLSPGNYYYQLITPAGNSGSRKMIVLK